MKIYQPVVSAIIAGVTVFINNMLGGWDIALQTLFVMMGADIILGAWCALWRKASPKTAHGAFSSEKFINGLFKKGGIITVVLVAYWLGMYSKLDYIRDFVIMFFVANEGFSVIETLGLMGVPIPQVLKNSFELLKDKSDNVEINLPSETDEQKHKK